MKPASKPPRVQKETRPVRRRWVRVVKWCALLGLLGVALMVGTVAIVFWMYGRDPSLPDYQSLKDYKPKQITTILDSNDRRIGEVFTERRTYVPYEKIPPIVVDAFVAAEDNKFWTHGGVDYWGMFRAFITNLRAGHTKQGASTITQQVVKNLLLTPERTFKRKIQEIILARRLETALTKQEIMTLYLNQIYFGQGRYGVQEASRYFFGKDVSQLDVGEAATLASLPNSPEPLSHELIEARRGQPLKHSRVKDRQVYVLNALAAAGKIKPGDLQGWLDRSIDVIKDPFPQLNSAPEWSLLARAELMASLKAQGKTDEEAAAELDTMGAQVRTTLDPSLQEIAQRSLQAGLRAVDKRHGIGHALRTIKPKNVDDEIARLAKKLPGAGPVGHDIYEAVVTEVFDDDHEVDVDLGNYKAGIALDGDADARFNPDKLKASERFKPGDVLLVVGEKDAADAKHARHRVGFAPGPQGAVVIIEVKSRKVRALVGGYTTKVAGFDRATMARRQPGSSFKPIVYTTAFLEAVARKCHANDPDDPHICATPGTIVNDTPEVFEKYGNWKPRNFETGTFEGHVRLRMAMAKSINTVSIHLAADEDGDAMLGKIATTAKAMGIDSKLPETMAIALGAGEVTPLEMTNAYATFAAGGITAKPRFVDAIDGKPTAVLAGTQAIPPEVAYVVANMLQSVTTEGTAAAANEKLHIPIAGKTGTSNDARDTWFIGLTPDYAIGVWVGYDDNRPQPGEQGARVALPVFIDIAKEMKLPAKQFTRPPHVVEATIDKASGLLAPDGAPKGSTMIESYVEGTEPTVTATKAGDVDEQHAVQSEYGD